MRRSSSRKKGSLDSLGTGRSRAESTESDRIQFERLGGLVDDNREWNLPLLNGKTVFHRLHEPPKYPIVPVPTPPSQFLDEDERGPTNELGLLLSSSLDAGDFTDADMRRRGRSRSQKTEFLSSDGAFAMADILPERDSLVYAIKMIGSELASHMERLDVEFCVPLLKSDVVLSMDAFQSNQQLNLDVQASTMPLLNISASLIEFGNPSEDSNEEDVGSDAALLSLVSSLSMLGSDLFLKNLALYCQSLNKLVYLFGLASKLPTWNPSSQKLTRSFSSTSNSSKEEPLQEKDLRVPISYLTELFDLLNVLDAILRKDALFPSCLVTIQLVISNLELCIDTDTWNGIYRHQVLDMHQNIMESVDKNTSVIPDIVATNVVLVKQGKFSIKAKQSMFRSKVQTVQYYLFNGCLLWFSATSKKFLESKLLTKKMTVSMKCDNKNNSIVVLHLPALSKKNNNIIEMCFDTIHCANLFAYLLRRCITQVPDKQTLADQHRVLSSGKTEVRRKNTLSDISRPFNVMKKEIMNEDMEWKGAFEDSFQILSKIGEGAFGAVYKVRHYDSGMMFAAKSVTAKSEAEEQNIRKEIELLKKCNNENIVSFYGIGGTREKLWILMEYCSAGSISHICSRFRDLNVRYPLSEDQIGFILSKICKALIWLHSRDIIHRDVKGANILLNEKGEVVLADFGVSKEIDVKNFETTKGIIGSPYWLPPESFRDKRPDIGDPRKMINWASKGDVWALGITAIEIAEGAPPRSDLPPFQAMLKIMNEQPETFATPGTWSDEFHNFVNTCLSLDPDERPSCGLLLQDPFIFKHLAAHDSRKILMPIVMRLGMLETQRQSGVGGARPSQPEVIEELQSVADTPENRSMSKSEVKKEEFDFSDDDSLSCGDEFDVSDSD